MKIIEMFDLNQGIQITDKEIYYSKGKIPILTGNNEIKGYCNKSIIKEEKLPVISYPTKGNAGVCYVQYSIFDANNTAILVPKKQWRKKIFLEWMTFKLSQIFPDIVTSKGGVSYLNKEIVENLEISIPSLKIQKVEFQSISKLLNFHKQTKLILEKIELIKSLPLANHYKEYQIHKVPITKILNSLSGNSGLTEEFLYSQIQYTLPRNYRLLTGSIDYSQKNYIYKCRNPKNPNKKIKVLENKEIIHVVRKGIFAGTVSFFEADNFTINDDTYLLFLKDKLDFEINLKWLMYQLKPKFFEFISSSDNKTWNKTGFFENIYVDIPSIHEQNDLVKEYDKLYNFEKSLHKIFVRISTLLRTQIEEI